MRLHLSSWTEIETYLKGSRGIVIPVGSTEQHGPSGLIGTDVICPEVIALKAAEEAGFLVAPSFNVGIAPHHMGFPRTISLRPETMIAAMGDWVRGRPCAERGFGQSRAGAGQMRELVGFCAGDGFLPRDLRRGPREPRDALGDCRDAVCLS